MAGEVDGADLTGESSPEVGAAAPPLLVDSFYDKLIKLNESSGLSLLFDFRETNLNLFKFYEEVTLRGGYHQVTNDGRWNEVASSLTSEDGPSLLPTQLQKIYGDLLYPFEQIHSYRAPAEVAATSGNRRLRRKMNCHNNFPLSIICFGIDQVPSAKATREDDSSQSVPGLRCVERLTRQKVDLEKGLNSPLRPRTAYQIFLRKECQRLRKIHGQSSNPPNALGKAIKAWRSLPERKRKRYLKESKKDKERYIREWKLYEEHKLNKPMPKAERPPNKLLVLKQMPQNEPADSHSVVTTSSRRMWPITDGNYHVSLQPAQSDMELTVRSMMKNAPANDCVFQINLKEC